MDKKTAIIIGAGSAGLTAAYRLLRDAGIKPIILEETEFIGGIARTVKHNGNRMDIGGHRFFSKNAEINRMWNELMPTQGAPSFDDKILGVEKPLAQGGPDPELEDRVMLVRNRISRILYLRKFFDYPISLKFKTFKNMGFRRTVKAGFGYMKSVMFKQKESSLENFYINRFGRPLYEMFFEDYTEKIWGRHPSRISSEWGAQRVKGLSLMGAVWNEVSKQFRSKNNVETSLIEQFFYPKRGPGQLWEILADDIRSMGGEIIHNCRVDKVNIENNCVKSVVAGGKTFEGDMFMSTMPVKDLVAGMAEAPPSDVREIAAGLPYRDFMTVGLLVRNLKLENTTQIKTLTGNVPDCWIYVQERDILLGRLQLFNNWSPYMLEDPQNTMWVGLEYFCDEGDIYWCMSDEEFINFVIDEMVKINIIDRKEIKDSVRIKVKKAYPAYFDSYSRFNTVKNYLSGIENLWCLGRNGQHRYNNMDHSMLTAIEAVNAIKSGVMSKETVWNVNTEKEYHEQKK